MPTKQACSFTPRALGGAAEGAGPGKSPLLLHPTLSRLERKKGNAPSPWQSNAPSLFAPKGQLQSVVAQVNLALLVLNMLLMAVMPGKESDMLCKERV